MIDTDLITHLVGLNTAARDRVYTSIAVQGAKRPFIAIERDTGAQPMTLSGTKLFERTQFDIFVVADDTESAQPIWQAIRDELHGFRDVLGGTGGTQIQSCRCISGPTPTVAPDGDLKKVMVQLGFLFVHSEA